MHMRRIAALRHLQHIPTVMDSVPQQDRCTCDPKTTVDDKQYPPKASSAD